jgi:hypothetical protein
MTLAIWVSLTLWNGCALRHSPDLVALLSSYLRGGREHSTWMGSTCRICGKANGSRCMTDGMFVWPEGLAHYVEDHHVALDPLFVSWIMRSTGQ